MNSPSLSVDIPECLLEIHFISPSNLKVTAPWQPATLFLPQFVILFWFLCVCMCRCIKQNAFPVQSDMKIEVRVMIKLFVCTQNSPGVLSILPPLPASSPSFFNHPIYPPSFVPVSSAELHKNVFVLFSSLSNLLCVTSLFSGGKMKPLAQSAVFGTLTDGVIRNFVQVKENFPPKEAVFFIFFFN